MNDGIKKLKVIIMHIIQILQWLLSLTNEKSGFKLCGKMIKEC